LLSDFSRIIYAAEHPDEPVSKEFTYPDWEMAFHAVGRLARRKRFAVILDEFPYAVGAEPALPSLLQRLWDHELRHTEIFLVLCGSHIGMMEKGVAPGGAEGASNRTAPGKKRERELLSP
jgi:hypothetical protein